MQLVDPKSAAKILSVSERTLEQWRRTNTGPTFTRLGGKLIRYRLDELERFTAAGERITINPAATHPIRPAILPPPRLPSQRKRPHRLGGYKTQRDRAELAAAALQKPDTAR